MGYREDKKWSDTFLPEIKAILGYYFISTNINEDMMHNTDLIVMKMDGLRFACRVRRYRYFEQYGHEFTIRSSRTANKTELSKIIEGWGDYFFYGFANATEDKLHHWFIGDLKVFRLWFNRCIYAGTRCWFEKKNQDHSSSFFVFDVRNMPEEFIIYSSEHSVNIMVA